MNFIKKINLLSRFFHTIEKKTQPKNTSIQERNRFYIYMYITLLLVIAIPLNLIGFTGPNELFYIYANSINLLTGILIFVLLYMQKIKLETSISALLIANQIEIALESIYCAINPSIYNSHLIVGNLVLSTIIIMLSILAYIRNLPLIISIISMGIYGTCILISDNEILQNFFMLYVLIFACLSLLGKKLIVTIQKLEAENTNLKNDEAEMLRILRINKPQIKAYIEFSKKKESTTEEMEKLLELIGERSQRNIINTVSNYLAEKHTKITIVAKTFPELTLSEVEIARLIIQGKKLKEICEILKKTENNITAHRGHIRKKLGLKPNENLQMALTERLRNSISEDKAQE